MWPLLYVSSIVGYCSRLGSEALVLVEIFAGAVLANFVTVTILYGLWRLSKNERDLKAMGMCLACFGVIVLAGFAGHS
jgi:hypothetical protein